MFCHRIGQHIPRSCSSFIYGPKGQGPLGGHRRVTTWTPLAGAFNTKPGRKINWKNENVGLFQIPELKDHSGFYLLQEGVREVTETLCNETVDPHRQRKIVQVFDDLSDSLCKVADMADFVRVAHPDKRYADAAEDTCSEIGVLVEKLNTNVSIHSALKHVIENGDHVDGIDVIDKRVAELFMFDFEQSGIHLEESKRQKFVELNESILALSSYFVQGAQRPIHVPKASLPQNLRHVFALDGDNIYVTGLFSDHYSDLVREAAYKIYLYPHENQLNILHSLLSQRNELANLVGFPTYAHRALGGTVAKTPENVMEFLTTLAGRLKDKSNEDFKMMSRYKHKQGAQDINVYPWDVSYYSGIARHEKCNVKSSKLAPFFSLGACMEGLNNLFKSIFGVTLENVDPSPGELWHSDIYKLAVTHETDGVLGHIYCDFFERVDKPNQDCHFTIRGGRENSDGSYQTPAVVLMLNLPPPQGRVPSLLTPGTLDNLFHEFGHAMHSMLGRTKYQHVTGTRCSTDFAEVPSVLMEYFVSDKRVLSSFARHYKTGESLPENVLDNICASRKMFQASDTSLQVFYSITDQLYHGKHPLGRSTTDILADTQNQFYGLPYVPGTGWQLRFSHLVGYGAKYYSYLMSRSVAAKIWQQYFKEDPFCRASGERYRREMLSHGGGKPPQDLIEAMLGESLTTSGLVQSLVDDIEG
ncbi:unnamed protein product [Owenia fusiformis]|uniref:Peptidase M3A/M3B catalytic domain-containing protein n=1 Tax=Owenia fusiformis TaxID=6347 RepID=A0A8J1V0E7_OWEFU|nr:unnamed protein product [Owenia fusiformis]CAH1781831.1 unnamed protein product [Owenia fusiformis]